jgi:hypothetical protein
MTWELERLREEAGVHITLDGELPSLDEQGQLGLAVVAVDVVDRLARKADEVAVVLAAEDGGHARIVITGAGGEIGDKIEAGGLADVVDAGARLGVDTDVAIRPEGLVIDLVF